VHRLAGALKKNSAAAPPRPEAEAMMRLLMILRVALKALNRNKMRTTLTMLA